MPTKQAALIAATVNPERHVKRENVVMTFSGEFNADSFIAFARHRARRLDLPLAVLAQDATAIALAVEGQVDLVDAFEMACSLGPHDCVVLDVTSKPGTPDIFDSRNERQSR